jgi:hypothetical protein
MWLFSIASAPDLPRTATVDDWRRVLRVDNKAQWLETVGKAPYEIRDLDSVKVELHGDIAITYGRYRARFKTAEPGRREFTVWFERVRPTRWPLAIPVAPNGERSKLREILD